MPETPPPPESPPPQRPLAEDGVAAPSSAEGILPQTTERLPATVRALGWTSFLTDLSSEAIYPLLPGFVIRELGGSAMNVGMIDGIANGIAAIVRLPSGAISDTLGRRPLVLVGYGLSGDAYHVTAPHPEGKGAELAMRMALRKAGLEPGDIDYVNAHGTSTMADTIELGAVKRVLKEHESALRAELARLKIRRGVSNNVDLLPDSLKQSGTAV
jgi:hypothetical protein